MPAEHDGYGDLRFTAPYPGVIVRVDDPEKIGRAKVRVPGLIDPESGWALPMTIGGGNDAHGIYFPPKAGSECLVFFSHGDVDHPYYIPANWHAPRGQGSQLNSRITGKSPAEAVKVKIIESERWLIVLDDTADTPAFLISDKQSGGLDQIEFNGLTRALTIKGTSQITIQSIGQITIQGLNVTINGRVVLPSGEPI